MDGRRSGGRGWEENGRFYAFRFAFCEASRLHQLVPICWSSLGAGLLAFCKAAREL